jgi:poly(A) polymerase Pap1
MMETAKFVLTAVGTFLSVLGLSFSVFQHWKKKQEEKLEAMKDSLTKKIQDETDGRREAELRLRDRVDKMDDYITTEFERRMGRIEGKLDGIAQIVGKVQDWFMSSPRRGE